MNNYYTYIYLDPRKKGRFTYDNFISFLFKPRYVGKGNRDRCFVHLYDSNIDDNKQLLGFIHNIKTEGYDPKNFIIKIIQFISDDCAKRLEKDLIRMIGRKDLNEGPLFNHTDGGTGGNTLGYHPNKKEILNKLHEKRRGMKHDWGFKISKTKLENPHIYTEEERKKLGNGSRGKVYINNGNINRKVFPTQLQQYLDSGWKKGCLPFSSDKRKNMGRPKKAVSHE